MSNAVPDIELKKTKTLKKKTHKQPRNWSPGTWSQEDMNPKSIWRKLWWMLLQNKTVWEKGPTMETPMQHKNGLKNLVTNFFFGENAKNLGRSDNAKRRKNGGWPEIKKQNKKKTR